MDVEYMYVDIMTWKNYHQFRLLFPLSFIEFIYPVGGDGVKGGHGAIGILASYKFHFIREHGVRSK